jgi:hypothetical protein
MSFLSFLEEILKFSLQEPIYYYKPKKHAEIPYGKKVRIKAGKAGEMDIVL